MFNIFHGSKMRFVFIKTNVNAFHAFWGYFVSYCNQRRVLHTKMDSDIRDSDVRDSDVRDSDVRDSDARVCFISPN